MGTNATGSASARSVRIIPDTYEDDVGESRGKEPEVRVEVDLPPDFDPSLYAVAPTSSASQTSQLEDQRIRARRLRIWDEDIVVPDFLDESGLSSERANPFGSLGTGSGISSNDTGSGHIQSSAGILQSQSISDSLAEPQSFLSAASYRATQSSSTQSQASSGNSQIVVNSTGSGSLGTELPNRQIDEPLPSLRHSVLSQTSLSLNDHGLNFDRPGSASSESQFSGFYTQIPRLSPLQISLDPNRRRPDNQEVSSRQISPTSKSQITHSSQDQILGSDPVTASQLQQSPSSQAPPFTFEFNWTAPQSAQIHRAISFSASLSASANSNKGNSQRSAPSQDIAQSIETSERASRNSASQKSRSSREFTSQTKSSQGHRSQSSHLPSPPSEEVLPSVEHHLPVNSPAETRHATPPLSDPFRESSQLTTDSPTMELPVKEEEFDATKALKARMEERRRQYRAQEEQKDRERTLSTMSPSPAVNIAPPTLPQPTLHVPVPTMNEDMVISNGVEAQLEAPRSPSFLNVEHESGTLDVVSNNDECLVALAMVASVRSVYDKAIREHKATLGAFTGGNVDDISEEMVYEVDALFENLRRLCDHQDTFDDSSSTQHSSTPLTHVEQTLWAETCSTKCMFLSHLLVRLANSNQPLHVVVVCRPAIMDILRDICQFRNLTHDFAGTTASLTDSGAFKVTLYPTGMHKINTSPASVVVAFGCDTSESQLLKHIRASPSALAPLISLVVTHSIEHLDRCFDVDDDLDGMQKRIRMAKCLRQLGGSMGIMDPQHDDPQHAANLVAQFLENAALVGTWPLPLMPEIDGVKLSLVVSNQDINAELVNGLNGPLQGLPSQARGVKRQVSKPFTASSPLLIVCQNEDLLDTASPKRQKLSPVGSDTAANMDISRVSDSVASSTAI